MTLTGCSAPAPFGGNCDELAPAASDALKTLLVMEDVATDGIDAKQKTAWDAGYEYLGQWSTELDDLEEPLKNAVGAEGLSEDESALLKRFEKSIDSSSALSFSMFSGDSPWFEDQKADLSTITAACK